MEEQKPPSEAAPSGPTPAPPKKGKGLWIGVAAVVIVVVILLGLYFAGFFSGSLPKAVYLIGYPGDAIKIVPSWYGNRAQWPVSWMYSEGLESQQFIDQLKSKGVNVSSIEGTAPVAPANATFNTTSASFDTRFAARYGHSPALFASTSYDAVFALALAMEKANSTNTNTTAFKQALRDVTNPPGEPIYPGEWAKARSFIDNGTDIDYFGASGAIDFNPDGEVTSDYMVWNVNATGQITEKISVPYGSWNATALAANSLEPRVAASSEPPAAPKALQPKIGTVMSLTGSLAQYGFDDQNGTDLAASDINGAGGIRGAQLQLLHQDDGTNPTQGAQVATTEISQGVQAIVGSLASSVSQTVFAKVAPAGIIEVTPASTAAYFTSADTTDQFWRTVPSDALQGQAAAWYAYVKAGYRQMSVMYINNLYGQGLASVFINAFKARGGQIFRSVSFEADQPDYTAQLQTLFTPGIAAAFIPAAVWRDEDV